MRTTTILIAILLGALALAAPAQASTTDTIVQDCQHSTNGQLSGSYTRKQLETALNNLPADVLEYSSCYDTIKQALLGGKSHTGGGGGTNANGAGGGAGGGGSSGGGAGAPGTGGSGSPASPSTASAPVPQQSGSKAPVALSSGAVQPGAIPAIGRDGHTLPTSAIVFLALLCAGALACAAATLGRRVIARHRT
jgi:hypothetical protein